MHIKRYVPAGRAPDASGAVGPQAGPLAPPSAETWTNAAGGDWQTPANWSGGAAPGASTDATIAIAGTYTVTIDTADQAGSLTIDAAGATVADLAGGVLSLSTTLSVTAGTFSLAGGTIEGGTISAGGGEFVATTGTFSGVTYLGTLDLAGSGDALYVERGFNALATGSSTVINLTGSGAYVDFLDSQTVDNATIDIGNAAYAFLYVGSTGATDTLIFGPNLSIVSAGAYGQIALTNTGETLINQGTITAGTTHGLLSITGTAAGDLFTNTGSLIATNGGTLLLDAQLSAGSLAEFSTSGGGVVELGATGTLTNTGSTLTLGAGRQLTLDAGGTVLGGTVDDTGFGLIAAGGSLSSASLAGTITLGNANMLTLKKGLTGSPGAAAAIDVTGTGASLHFEGSQTVDGLTLVIGNASSSGQIEFDRTKATGTLTFGSGLAVTSAGAGAQILLANGSDTLINQGTITAGTNGGQLTISAGKPGDVFVNQGSLLATNGGTLIVDAALTTQQLGNFSTGPGGVFELASSGLLNNAGATLVLDAGHQLTLEGNIEGGTITDAASNLIAAAGTLSGVIYVGTLDIGPGQELTVENSLAVSSGTINVGGGGMLIFVDTQTVDNFTINAGTGYDALQFNSTGGAGTVTLGPSVTVDSTGIYGGGIAIGNGETLVNQGTMTANVSGMVLAFGQESGAIRYGNIFVNEGSLVAANGGTIQLSLNVTTLELGEFSTVNGGVFDMRNTLDNRDATLTVGADRQFTLDGFGMIEGGTIVDSGGGFITNGGTLSGVTYLGTLTLGLHEVYVEGGLTGGPGSMINDQQGRVLFVDTQSVTDIAIDLGFSGGIEFESTATTGTLTFDSSVNIFASAAGTHSIAFFSSNPETLINQGILASSSSNGTLFISGGSYDVFTNTGTLVATNSGTINVEGFNFTNLDHTTLSGGSYEVDANSTMKLANADNIITGIVTDNANITLSGANSVLTCQNTTTGSYTTLDSTLTNIGAQGALTLLDGRNFTTSAAFADNGLLQLGGTAFSAASLTISATGAVLGYGSISGTITDNGIVTASGGTLTLASRLFGTGTIGAATGAVLDLTAGGTIIQTVSGTGTLELGAAFILGTAPFAIGEVLIDAGGSLAGPGRIGGAVVNNGALTAASGLFAISGALTGGGSVTVGAGATLSLGGGDLTGATTDNGTIAVTIGTLVVAGTLSGSGGFSVGAGASLEFSGGGMLAGPVTGQGMTAIETATTLAAGATLQTASVLQNADLAFGAGVALTQAAGQTWTMSEAKGQTVTLGGTGGSFTESGALTQAGSGHAQVDAAFINQGLVSVQSGKFAFLGPTTNDGTMAASGGVLQFNAHVTGTGTDTIAAGATLSFLNGASGHQTIDFLAGTGLLDLTNPARFAGHIGGFGAQDRIDLVHTAATSLSFAHGQLDVINGTTTVATLAFDGNYTSANFTLATDNQGGALILFHP